MTWCVYLLICSDGTLYCGSTNDLEKRVIKHNSKSSGAKYTKTRQPVKLFKSFPCESKSEALKLEYKIKQLSRKEKLNL